MFPQESVAQAQLIAQSYRRRTNLKENLTRRLYDGQFLHLNYGFEDALEKGTCGLYLHEAEKDADCFSLLGMLYLIARELDLEPQMYRANTFKSYTEGEDPANGKEGEHGFLTVQLGGEETVVDPLHELFGKVKWLGEHSFKVYDRDRGLHKVAEYSLLTSVSESDFVETIEYMRTPEGGRMVLQGGQTLETPRGKVTVELDEGSLLTSKQFTKGDINSLPQEKVETLALRTPVVDGRLVRSEAEYINFWSPINTWRASDRTPSVRIGLPVWIAEKYSEHIALAGKQSGRKTPVSEYRGKDYPGFVASLGFSYLGELGFENGVPLKEHVELLDAIDAAAQTNVQTTLAKDILSREGKYILSCKRNRSKNNPWGFLHSPKEMDLAMENALEEWWERNNELQRLHKEYTRSFLFAKPLYHPSIRLGIAGAKFDEQNLSIKKMGWLRRGSAVQYYQEMDFLLFNENVPLGSVPHSDEEITVAHRKRAHDALTFFAPNKPALTLWGYRKGINRILAQK